MASLLSSGWDQVVHIRSGRQAVSGNKSRDYKTIWVLHGQVARPISTGKLSALLHVHIQPINVVVFNGPSGTCVREISS